MKKFCKFRWWKEQERIFVCHDCGFADHLAEGFTLAQVHRQCHRPKFGLGDYVAAGLELIGITKARAAAAGNLLGIPGCGCDQRQEKLNAIGEKLGM